MNKPRILFFNVNGSGLGHMNRCLAYAKRLQDKAHPVFFSLASAMEIIEEMGFEADYFVSHYWSGDSTFSWNSELAVRFGLMLECVCPSVVVFDGTWPFQGFLAACNSYDGNPALVWSNRGLLKKGTTEATVDGSVFDLIIQPGEVGGELRSAGLSNSENRLPVPPVCLLNNDELLDRSVARQELGLSDADRLVLFSLGPGNLKDVTSVGYNLIKLFEEEGFSVVWAQAPISVQDVEFPPSVKNISKYPLVKYMHAFDVFVGAAGYNTCCEVVQTQIPSLLVPNTMLVDDQAKRAKLVAEVAPAVVSSCETIEERYKALKDLLAYIESAASFQCNPPPMNGAALGADAIASLVDTKGIR